MNIKREIAEMAVEIYFTESDLSVKECIERAERIKQNEDAKKNNDRN